jgi:hypothetical protein
MHPAPFTVTRWDPVQRCHVQQAAAEYDRLGQDEFLACHGFGRATAYLLILAGKRYDSKAILGVAYQIIWFTVNYPAAAPVPALASRQIPSHRQADSCLPRRVAASPETLCRVRRPWT